ncbi:MAG: sulfite exporter TauE/SafE family protein [Armatimonadota bacterium]|nr:sulfite exporter TauE/SafE family protein [Armatimonadota bacterium]
MDGLPIWAPLLIFVVAVLYSSVGHGGASGYLAVLSLLAIPRAEMATTALALNILVAGTACLNFHRSNHLRLRLTWPLIVLSIPGALIGGAIYVPERVYSLLLAVALLAAAVRLSGLLNPLSREEKLRPLRLPAAVPLGGAIGLLSGIVGIGGGVFLSPVMILARWAGAKQVAATSACFIVVNSIAGLSSRMISHNADFGIVPALPLAAFAGGLIGSSLGARRFSSLALRRVLATVLVTAAVKLL